jgi:tRNA threonylcarbamoyladenosine dehydratase
LERFSRNLGLLTLEQQKRLYDAKVAVCGVGGMGGVAVEALARMGVQDLRIADHDTYDRSNTNRQLHCTEKTLGKKKTEVIATRLKQINPKIKVRSFTAVKQSNVDAILKGVDIVINGMDNVRASILLERAARAQGKTIVDSWITPFASVFVMTPRSPHWETFLDFPTIGKKVEEITDADVRACLEKETRFTLSQFDALKYVSEKVVREVLAGSAPRPSLLPVVWLSGTLMANEAMKILTRQGRIASHWGVFYNQYAHELRFYNSNEAFNGKPSTLKIAG